MKKCSAALGVSNQVLNAMLDDIATGPRDENGEVRGEPYSNAPAAKERAAWPVVRLFAPHTTEKQCREIIRTKPACS